MTLTDIAQQRLATQRLTQQPFATPEEVVSWLGCVQSQEYAGAKWSLGMRMQNATEAAIDEAFNEGRILRTHIMRPTWHFVTPDDIRWILELTAPRVNALNASYYRQQELDEALFVRSNDIIVKALEGGKQLTRAELGVVLAQSGIVTDAMRLGFIMHRAELDAIVCSGGRRGKQFTYALLNERAPHAKSLPRDEALAELTRRYYTGHGPATVHDFVWWSGLTIADAKAGIQMVGSQLAHEVIDGKTYWFSASITPSAEPSEKAFLLPTFDEFLVGFDAFDKARTGGRGFSDSASYSMSPLVFAGKVIGSWKRTFKKKSVVIELQPFEPLTAAEMDTFTIATQRYGEFHGMPAMLG